jgi:hypothetical protein
MKLQFSLRDLVWTIVVAALACAWWLEHRSAAKAREHAHFLRQEYNLVQSNLRECMDYVNELEPPPNKLQGE